MAAEIFSEFVFACSFDLLVTFVSDVC
jgi:hypothetical protein